MQNNATDILKKLISIDSRNSKSNKEIIFYIKKLFENKAETHVQKLKKDKLELFNLIVKIPGKSSKNPIIFVGHTDTVNPSPKWQRDPFKAVVEDDKIFGLGASDMQSGLAAMIAAGMTVNNPTRDVYMVFDADEEDRGTGGKKVVEYLKDLDIHDAEIIVAEPTDGDITIGQKACFSLRIETFGKTGHSSQTSHENNLKNSAIYKANKIINELISHELNLSRAEPDKVYGYSSQNIGQITGGTNVNSVADFCYFTIDRRLLPAEDMRAAIKKTQDLIRTEVPDAKVIVEFEGESFNTQESEKLVQKIATLAHSKFGKKKFKVSYGWNEAALFSKFGKAVIFGPGIHAQCHQPDEYASIGMLNSFADIYREVMTL
jgi:succinyl-diaminopimelate desuccinylase